MVTERKHLVCWESILCKMQYQSKIHMHVVDMVNTMSSLCHKHKLLHHLPANPLFRNDLHGRSACFETLIAVPVPKVSSLANHHVGFFGWLSWEGMATENNYILTKHFLGWINSVQVLQGINVYGCWLTPGNKMSLDYHHCLKVYYYVASYKLYCSR